LKEKEITFESAILRIVRSVITEEKREVRCSKGTGLEESQKETIGDPRKLSSVHF